MHNAVTKVHGQEVFWISVLAFIAEMAQSVRGWWAAYGDTAVVQRNYAKYARRHPDGLPPFVVGAPVIA